MYTLKRHLWVIIGLASGLWTALPAITHANLLNSDVVANINTSTGLKDTGPVDITINIIAVFLGLLGIIALCIIVYAGFRWMTAAGNEDQVTEAKGMLKAAVLGIAVILASYSIAQFIFSNIESVTGQGAIGLQVPTATTTHQLV
jgi:hypothetical protein